jgi:hypothetical protein
MNIYTKLSVAALLAVAVYGINAKVLYAVSTKETGLKCLVVGLDLIPTEKMDYSCKLDKDQNLINCKASENCLPCYAVKQNNNSDALYTEKQLKDCQEVSVMGNDGIGTLVTASNVQPDVV